MDFENRPMMLKDFLGYCNSCNVSSSSSNGFRRNPRNNQSCKSTAVMSSTQPSIMLLRSRSKRAAATTISAIQKVISVVRFFHFESVKSPPSVLRRNNSSEEMAKVKVKDILRWRSFRDLEEDQKRSTPLDFPTSLDPTSSISSSSWCEPDSDEELPDSWVNRNEEFLGKKLENWSVEEESDSEQQSPVSVLYSPFQQVPIKLSNLERSKCKLTKRFSQEIAMDKNAAPANFEERARQLIGEPGACKTGLDWNLVRDFYMDEVMSGKVEDSEVLNAVRSWMNGEYREMYEWELEDNRKAYVEDMERGVSWIKFKQEQDEVSRELEFELLDEMLDNLLVDFLAR